MAACRILDLGCVHCPKHQTLYSGINGLMSQVLERVAALVVLCVMLKQSFAFFPPFVLGYKSVWKINHRWSQNSEFSFQFSLRCPSSTILRLGLSSLSLFLLANICHPHPRTLERTNLPWLDPSRNHPKKVARDILCRRPIPESQQI